MSEEKNYTNQVNNKEKTSNVELIYGYTESLVKTQEDSLNRLDTKLSAFLAFAGVSLRFVDDLPNKSELAEFPLVVINTSLTLKVFACIFSAASIVVCVSGLVAQMRGDTVDPEILMGKTWYWEEPSYYRAFVIRTWIDVSKQYKAIGQKKGKILNLAIILICAAAAAFASDTILLSFYR